MLFTFAGSGCLPVGFLSEHGVLDIPHPGCMGAVVLWLYSVYLSFLVLPVCCRYFHVFWHVSG